LRLVLEGPFGSEEETEDVETANDADADGKDGEQGQEELRGGVVLRLQPTLRGWQRTVPQKSEEKASGDQTEKIGDQGIVHGLFLDRILNG